MLFWLLWLSCTSFSGILWADALEPDWSEQMSLPLGTDRKNIFSVVDEQEQKSLVMRGRLHALHYPVTVTQLKVPYTPLFRTIENKIDNLLLKLIYSVAKDLGPFKRFDDFEQWLGLNPYPRNLAEDPQKTIPFPDGHRPDFRMGSTRFKTPQGLALTYSCAACHTGNLFGQKIFGMTNRFPRANDFFYLSKQLGHFIPPELFQRLTEATKAETKMYKNSMAQTKWIGVRRPLVKGLDTSLASVGLSLALREADEYASKTQRSYRYPRKTWPVTHPADSKPMVWWNVKFKTRWLSDGSIISGNPIFTNFLWNEIGRGMDLRVLEKWLDENRQVMNELTAAVFATEAPRYSDFFGVQSLNLAKAKKGEQIYLNHCSKCHGEYIKGWSTNESDQFATVEVRYHEKTPVKNVGTDAYRRLGMKFFAEDLNRLKISKKFGTVVVPQEGYVPPPLVGIWARWPYFHNNSIPNLCALLSVVSDRPKSFYIGEAIDRQKDFDQECNGYPVGRRVPIAWKTKSQLFDTRVRGLSNQGHEKMLVDQSTGREKFSKSQKLELIEFLKTL